MAQGSKPIAVVAGATGGIGSACARELRSRGYELVLNARREEPLKALAQELGGSSVTGDCAEEDVCAAVAALSAGVQVLVHSVGQFEPRWMKDQTGDDFDAVIRANLRSAYVLVRALVPAMEPGARVIFISSIAPKTSVPQTSAYSAAKAGLNALANVLARELENDGILFNLVSPGPVDTGMLTDTPNPYASLSCQDVSEVVGWLTTLAPHVLIRELDMRAVSRGPFAQKAATGSTSS